MAKVLVVEDNEANRDLVTRYLELFDHEVTVAVDGEQALETARVRGRDLDIVLMDMSLPEIDGWEATRLLKADEATKHLPVIAVTAHAMVGDREKAMEAGCDYYCTKPVDFDALFRQIELLCNSAAE